MGILDSILGTVESTVGSVINAGQNVIDTIGITGVNIGDLAGDALKRSGYFPLEAEMKSIDDKENNLKSLYYQAEDRRNKLPQIVQNYPLQKAALPGVDKALSQAMSQCVAAQNLLADAYNAGVDAQEAVKGLEVNAKDFSVFFVKKKAGDTAYDAAFARINDALAKANDLQAAVTKAAQVTRKDVTAAVTGALTEIRDKAEGVVTSAGKFAPYLPYVIGIGIAAYFVLPMLTLRRKG